MSCRRIFTLDRANAKWMGVCAGIANHFGIDATFVRIGVVLLTLLGGFPWTVIAYLVAGFLAKSKRRTLSEGDYRSGGRLSTHDVRSRMRDIDRRMAEVESYVAHSNVRLAREIEALR